MSMEDAFAAPRRLAAVGSAAMRFTSPAHLVPVNHPLHNEAELQGDANAHLVAHGCPPPVELAAVIWSVHEEIRQELERVERGGAL
jgi:hypothetical protein